MDLAIYSSEVAVGSSRSVQESLKIEQGVSVYGAMAAFMDANFEQLDRLAEYCAQMAAYSNVKELYDKQYFDNKHKVKSFWTRNIYLNEDKKNKMEGDRFVKGAVSQLVTESAIKGASRFIRKWAYDKDKFVTCEQVYAVLLSYITNAKNGANVERANIELNKIRNSFPLSLHEKKKLYNKYKSGTINFDSLNVSSVVSPNNIQIKNALAYFLTVINRQLYGADEPDNSRMLDYYSLLDINGQYGTEFMLENQHSYDSIAADQVAYLQLSRAMVKNMFVDIPNIDLEGIINRANEMAKYDPYSIRRKKVKGATKGAALSITGIVSKNPELAFNGLSTAISQFTQNDQLLSTVKDKVKDWGIGGNDADMIFANSKNISDKSKESDLIDTN